MKNKLSIQVFGSEYHITSVETPEYVQQLGQEIDESIRKIINTSQASLNEALVLVALSYLDSYKKAEQGADHLREQVTEYLEEASQSRLDLTKAKAELERLGRDHQLKIE